jgi:hypothetical protein
VQDADMCAQTAIEEFHQNCYQIPRFVRHKGKKETLE